MTTSNPKADERRDDPPEVVVERMTNALKRALHTPPKPHKSAAAVDGDKPKRGRPKKNS
jgi:hypothetical protein